jgi:tRNA (guanine26-N2/guanine27-N2)-dimethyltransferase
MRLGVRMEAKGVAQSEGAALFQTGKGFFNPASRPSRDLGVLLARTLKRNRPVRVLDLMAGCGLRSLRYGLEAEAASLWANDGDRARLPILQTNLGVLESNCLVRLTHQSAHRLLADCLLRGERFDVVDVDAFGSPHALLPLALEAVALDGVLYLASTDGRGPTGHDRRASLRRMGASARCHPASWEQAIRLQLGMVARAAWSLGRGVEPLFSHSDGRSFRTAIRLRRHPRVDEETQLGMVAFCHGCGDQQVQSLFHLDRWVPCRCSPTGMSRLAVSGPLWIGPLQDRPTLDRMGQEAVQSPITISKEGSVLLARLQGDSGWPARCWPYSLIARQIGPELPSRQRLMGHLRQRGFLAVSSAVMPGQIRSDAPWEAILGLVAELVKDRDGGVAGC